MHLWQAFGVRGHDKHDGKRRAAHLGVPTGAVPSGSALGAPLATAVAKAFAAGNAQEETRRATKGRGTNKGASRSSSRSTTPGATTPVTRGSHATTPGPCGPSAWRDLDSPPSATDAAHQRRAASVQRAAQDRAAAAERRAGSAHRTVSRPRASSRAPSAGRTTPVRRSASIIGKPAGDTAIGARRRAAGKAAVAASAPAFGSAGCGDACGSPAAAVALFGSPPASKAKGPSRYTASKSASTAAAQPAGSPPTATDASTNSNNSSSSAWGAKSKTSSPGGTKAALGPANSKPGSPDAPSKKAASPDKTKNKNPPESKAASKAVASAAPASTGAALPKSSAASRSKTGSPSATETKLSGTTSKPSSPSAPAEKAPPPSSAKTKGSTATDTSPRDAAKHHADPKHNAAAAASGNATASAPRAATSSSIAAPSGSPTSVNVCEPADDTGGVNSSGIRRQIDGAVVADTNRRDTATADVMDDNMGDNSSTPAAADGLRSAKCAVGLKLDLTSLRSLSSSPQNRHGSATSRPATPTSTTPTKVLAPVVIGSWSSMTCSESHGSSSTSRRVSSSGSEDAQLEEVCDKGFEGSLGSAAAVRPTLASKRPAVPPIRGWNTLFDSPQEAQLRMQDPSCSSSSRKASDRWAGLSHDDEELEELEAAAQRMRDVHMNAEDGYCEKVYAFAPRLSAAEAAPFATLERELGSTPSKEALAALAAVNGQLMVARRTAESLGATGERLLQEALRTLHEERQQMQQMAEEMAALEQQLHGWKEAALEALANAPASAVQLAQQRTQIDTLQQLLAEAMQCGFLCGGAATPADTAVCS